MKHNYRTARTAAHALSMFTPQGSGRRVMEPHREVQLPYARTVYPTFDRFAEALERDHKVKIDERYRGKVPEPVEIGTNCRIRLYFRKDGEKYRVLTARDPLTEEQILHAFEGMW